VIDTFTFFSYIWVKIPGLRLAAERYSRPKKFYLKSQASQLDLSDTAISKEPTVVKKKRFDFLEKDLHPYLTYYAYYHLHCYTKTINHSQSSKKEFGEWVHPDIVGCYFPLDDWKQEVYELSSSIGNISIRLLSFELKRELSFGNLRESFFQTVSNSSWANESYLVAAEVSEEEEFRNELSRLSTSFGIGVITYNTGLAKVAVQCSADTFVVNQSLVLRINICGENRHLRQARNR
jgi:uncharacterized protein